MKPQKIALLLFSAALAALPFATPALTGQAQTPPINLYPHYLSTYRGSTSDQPLSVLAELDQWGNDDDWDRYIEFYTARRGYLGMFSFDLPLEVDPADITALSLETNYRGPTRAVQGWWWQLRDFDAGRWVTLGGNGGAADWLWTQFSFDAPGDPGRFVSDDRLFVVRYLSLTGADDSDLDYLALVVATNGTPTPTPTTPGPTPTPTPTPEPGNVWQPAPGTSWQWQLSGPIDISFDVQMYDIDLFDVPQEVMDQLHADGRVVICYFSAGSWEAWRPDADQFPESVLGNPLEGWPGERWLDIRQMDVLGPIMGARMDLAVQKGCDGVEPDNVDGYSNHSGFPLTYQDQINYNVWLATAAHSRGLSIGLKNDLDQIADLLPYFDWALNEQCFQFAECETLLPFVQAGKAVFGVEYYGRLRTFCPRANAMDFDWLKKRLELDAWRRACR